jgi:molybdopterin/thiamine biosynthesis adenylyltransferase
MTRLSAEEFYALRDDRTNRLTDARDYHRLRVCVTAGPATVSSFAGQVTLLLTANLLARWCRQVELVFPDAPLDPMLVGPGHSTFRERVLAEMRAADPFGAFRVVDRPGVTSEYLLVVGEAIEGIASDFQVMAAGWEIGAGQSALAPITANDPRNPLGAAFAACLGVADAFKVASHQPDKWRIQGAHFDLFNLSLVLDGAARRPSLPSFLDLGNALLVGLGSVGSATAYILRLLPVTGTLYLVDHDAVGIENLNRSPVFNFDDVGRCKVDVVADYLAGAIEVEPFPMLFDEFIPKRGRTAGETDLVFSMANEFGVRAQIEHNMPPLQLYGTTARSGVVNFHRHIPLVEDCSMCRFPPLPDDVTPQYVCSDARVEVEPGKQIDAALPFMSVAAAVLAVTDFVRLTSDSYPAVFNFADIDLMGPLEYLGHRQRLPRTDCSCRSRSTSIHHRFIESTQFFRASVTSDV